MAEVELRNLLIEFDGFKAVDDVNLTVRNGEFVVYLGPSGCGKTTTLRAIAGLQGVTSGDVLFDGKSVNHLKPSERNIAMVFQFVSLYPNLTIAENVTFPLKARGVSKAEIRRKLDWVTGIFQLGDDLRRYPAALPPGARQKVALARAVIRDPAVLLLDEPLSAIDEQFREEMRWELGHLQRELGVTTIYVTHDQREAMSLADRIVLMNHSKIVQVDEPSRIFHEPASVFAGQFIGSPSMNIVDLVPVPDGFRLGDSPIVLTDQDLPRGLPRSGGLRLGIRPRDLRLVSSPGHAIEIDDTFTIGRERFFTFRIGEMILQGSDQRDRPGPGSITLDPDGMVFFDAATGLRLAERVAA